MGNFQRPRLFVTIRSYRNWAECRRCIVQLKLALAKAGYSGQAIHVIGDESYPEQYATVLRKDAKQRLGSRFGQQHGPVFIHRQQRLTAPYSSQGHAAALAVALAFQRRQAGEDWDYLLLIDDDFMIRSHQIRPFLGYLLGPMLMCRVVGITGFRFGMLRLEVDGVEQRRFDTGAYLNGAILIRRQMLEDVGNFLPLHSHLAVTDFISRGLSAEWTHRALAFRYDKPNPYRPSAGERGKGWVVTRSLSGPSRRIFAALSEPERQTAVHLLGVQRDALLLQRLYAPRTRYGGVHEKPMKVSPADYGQWTKGLIIGKQLEVTYQQPERWRRFTEPALALLQAPYPPADRKGRVAFKAWSLAARHRERVRMRQRLS